MLDSKRLFYFTTVVKAGSLSGAETMLDIAQSVLSRAIQQLEADVGVQLLRRNGRGVELTAQGDILYRRAEAILGDMAATLTEIKESTSRASSRLAIATPPAFSSQYMPEIIRRLLLDRPALNLKILEASTGQVYDYLAAGEVDLAVILTPPKTPKITLSKIYTESLGLVMHPDHPLAGLPVITRAQLRKVDLILPATSHGTHHLLEKYFADKGIPPGSLQIDSLAIARSVIAQAPRFCMLLATQLCREDVAAGRLVIKPLKPSLSRTLYLARAQGRVETPEMADILSHMMAVLSESDSLPMGEPVP